MPTTDGSISSIDKLLSVLRAHGVQSFRQGDLAIEFGEPPLSSGTIRLPNGITPNDPVGRKTVNEFLDAVAERYAENEEEMEADDLYSAS